LWAARWHRAAKSGKSQLSTLSTVHAAVSNISEVEGNIRASQGEANAKKIETADLASKAAGHIDLCSSVRTQVINALMQTQSLLNTAERNIDMAAEVRSYDEEAENNEKVYTRPTTDIYSHVIPGGTQC
jgi:hypothetical protein